MRGSLQSEVDDCRRLCHFKAIACAGLLKSDQHLYDQCRTNEGMHRQALHCAHLRAECDLVPRKGRKTCANLLNLVELNDGGHREAVRRDQIRGKKCLRHWERAKEQRRLERLQRPPKPQPTTPEAAAAAAETGTDDARSVIQSSASEESAESSFSEEELKGKPMGKSKGKAGQRKSKRKRW
ncbi:hypothetical protein EBZ37_10800 [bacterium]|nr:hypothetical protein [bacterium]